MKVRLAVAAALVALTCFAAPARARADEAPGPATSHVPATATAPASAAATTEPPPVAGKRTVWPWILMGTGVALVVTATILEVNAISEDDKRESEEVKLTSYAARPATDPDKKALQASVDDHSKSASNERTAALIVGTVGFLTIAGSVVLWFYEGSKSSTPPATATLKPTFVPSLSPTYAGATLGTSF